jgi:hypothetical protein
MAIAGSISKLHALAALDTRIFLVAEAALITKLGHDAPAECCLAALDTRIFLVAEAALITKLGHDAPAECCLAALDTRILLVAEAALITKLGHRTCHFLALLIGFVSSNLERGYTVAHSLQLYLSDRKIP